MSADKFDVFDAAFKGAERNAYASAPIDRAKQTIAYLGSLVGADEKIASFTVAEIIEHLNRRL